MGERSKAFNLQPVQIHPMKRLTTRIKGTIGRQSVAGTSDDNCKSTHDTHDDALIDSALNLQNPSSWRAELTTFLCLLLA